VSRLSFLSYSTDARQSLDFIPSPPLVTRTFLLVARKLAGDSYCPCSADWF
jgi:hypothetical protein